MERIRSSVGFVSTLTSVIPRARTVVSSFAPLRRRGTLGENALLSYLHGGRCPARDPLLRVLLQGLPAGGAREHGVARTRRRRRRLPGERAERTRARQRARRGGHGRG